MQMSRTMVGLLATVGAAMSMLAGLAHGSGIWSMVAVAALTTGLAAYLAFPPAVSAEKCRLLVITRITTSYARRASTS